MGQRNMMLLAGKISDNPARVARARILGPQDPLHYSVRQVFELISSLWQCPALQFMDNPLPEAGSLALDSSIARNLLRWRPAWDTERVIAETAGWYRDYYHDRSSTRALTMHQILSW